jgi:hypothetical protein
MTLLGILSRQEKLTCGHGIMNGSPTPVKLEKGPGQISAEWTGVGEPFIIPRSPRARQ